MDRRQLSNDVEEALKRLTWYIHPARHDDLYRAGAIDPTVVPVSLDGMPLEEMTAGSGEMGAPIYDTDLVDKYFDDLDTVRETNGAAVFGALAGSGEWE